MGDLQPENLMRVEGVITHEWIPFLKTYGPLRRCSIKVKDILNLLNNNVNVILTDEKNKQLYLFTKEWNAYAEISGKPQALRAEEILYERVYKEAIQLQKEDDKSNPFVSDPDEEMEMNNAVNNIRNSPRSNTMNNPILNMNQQIKLQKPKMYDMIVSKDRNLTPIQQNDILMDTIQFGDIEFE